MESIRQGGVQTLISRHEPATTTTTKKTLREGGVLQIPLGGEGASREVVVKSVPQIAGRKELRRVRLI